MFSIQKVCATALTFAVLLACPASAEQTDGEQAFAATIDACEKATSVADVVANLTEAGFTELTPENVDHYARIVGYQDVYEYGASLWELGGDDVDAFNAKMRRELKFSWDNRRSEMRDFQTNAFSQRQGRQFLIDIDAAVIVTVGQTSTTIDTFTKGPSAMISCRVWGNGGAVFDAIYQAFETLPDVSTYPSWYSTKADEEARLEGGQGGPYIVKRYDPETMQIVFDVEMVAPDFLMFFSQPF